MIGLRNHIKVIVVRHAAGLQKKEDCYQAARARLRYPADCNQNFQELYEVEKPSKVIQVMNFAGARSTDFTPFMRSDMENPVSLQRELQNGEEIICIWNGLLGLKPTQILDGLTKILPSKGIY